MATVVANSDAGALLAHVQGDQRVLNVKVTDSAYASGGTVITPASVGLLQIDSIISTSTFGGKPTYPIRSAAGVWSVMVFSAIGTEVVAAVDLSATDPYVLRVTGK